MSLKKNKKKTERNINILHCTAVSDRNGSFGVMLGFWRSIIMIERQNGFKLSCLVSLWERKSLCSADMSLVTENQCMEFIIPLSSELTLPVTVAYCAVILV